MILVMRTDLNGLDRSTSRPYTGRTMSDPEL
jgi:hypothetical protein